MIPRILCLFVQTNISVYFEGRKNWRWATATFIGSWMFYNSICPYSAIGVGSFHTLLLSYLLIFVPWKLVHIWFDIKGHTHYTRFDVLPYKCCVKLIPIPYMTKLKYVSSILNGQTNECGIEILTWKWYKWNFPTPTMSVFRKIRVFLWRGRDCFFFVVQSSIIM